MFETEAHVNRLRGAVHKFSNDIISRLRNYGTSILKSISVDEEGKAGELEVSCDEQVDPEKSYVAFEQSYPVIKEGELFDKTRSALRIWIFDRKHPTYMQISDGIAEVKRRMRSKDVKSALTLIQNMHSS